MDSRRLRPENDWTHSQSYRNRYRNNEEEDEEMPHQRRHPSRDEQREENQRIEAEKRRAEYVDNQQKEWFAKRQLIEEQSERLNRLLDLEREMNRNDGSDKGNGEESRRGWRRGYFFEKC